ncbi:hypothetical protein DPMN_181760 [Dreissena polymorpha]|uniref:Laminin EGF-like domain-containing protein n=1 Tax=Dreissena polymorpha TaxID=45954 RepID=A0A9D4DF40_DREPO|nr:hypothetical protein DPMN_181760 [Dreissena polymorpha]
MMFSECSDNTYGSNCYNPCTCVKEHTHSHNQSCDIINGACMCTGNWTGKTCDLSEQITLDIDD